MEGAGLAAELAIVRLRLRSGQSLYSFEWLMTHNPGCLELRLGIPLLLLTACSFQAPNGAQRMVSSIPTPDPLPTKSFQFPESSRQEFHPISTPTAPAAVENVATSGHFNLHVNGLLVGRTDLISLSEAEVIRENVFDQMAESYSSRVDLYLMPRDRASCPIRGTAVPTDQPRIFIYVAPDSSSDEVSAILAHELAHIVQYSILPQRSYIHVALMEGHATWGAKQYWLPWQGYGTFEDLIRSYLDEGEYLPLRKNYEWTSLDDLSSVPGDCIALRDKLYSEWAGFVDWLMVNYGPDRFLELIRSSKMLDEGGTRYFVPVNYAGVYGRSLNQLESIWLAEMDAAGR